MEFSHGERLSVCLCYDKTAVEIALTYYTHNLSQQVVIVDDILRVV